ncbi:MAG: hypothetical protein V7L02_03265 [Nostoc sp.]
MPTPQELIGYFFICQSLRVIGVDQDLRNWHSAIALYSIFVL